MAAVNENELVRKFKANRRAFTPIIGIESADQTATIKMLVAKCNGKSDVPMLTWDVCRGFVEAEAENPVHVAALATVKQTINPVEAMQSLAGLDKGSIVFVYNAHHGFHSPQFLQAVFNLRDQFKGNGRTLVLLGPQLKLPDEITNDVVELDDPLPGDAELKAICRGCYDGWQNVSWDLSNDDVDRAAAALKGCSAFGAEQHFTMASAGRKDGIDWTDLNESVRKTIEQTPGLAYEEGKETFSDVGGLNAIKNFGERLFAGPRRPALVVRIEEIEKATRGAEGDLSGTSMDAMQVMLSSMEDFDWSGLIAYGAAGCSKSLFSKALANTFNVRGLVFDMGACRGSLVGESERKVRQAVKTIRAIGGDRVFFVASCNDAASINTALKRRFRSGTYFFDLPDTEDRKEIWDIQRERWQVPPKYNTPDEADLTGADIRNICEQSHALGMSLKDARRFVVPLKSQDSASIDECRAQAKGRYLDANRGGTYQGPKTTRGSGARRIEAGEED